MATEHLYGANAATHLFPGGYMMYAVADFDDDGHADLLLVTQGRPWIWWGGPGGYAAERRTPLPVATLPGGDGVLGLGVADLDGDGRLDLVLTSGLLGRREPGDPVVGGTGIKGTTRNSRAFIYWGNRAWDATERSALECYNALDVTVADLNKDGHLDLAFSSYISETTRELPAFIYWGDGTRAYTERRRSPIDAASSASMDALDLNRDGWPELIVTNHQRNFSHLSGTYLYWGGPEGYSTMRRTLVPSIGAHLDAMVDAGNIRDRALEWELVSVPVEAQRGAKFERLRWSAATAPGTAVKFQVRTAASPAGLAGAAWSGPDGAGSYYTVSDRSLAGLNPDHAWLQYRAVLSSADGANSALLQEVELVTAGR